MPGMRSRRSSAGEEMPIVRLADSARSRGACAATVDSHSCGNRRLRFRSRDHDLRPRMATEHRNTERKGRASPAEPIRHCGNRPPAADLAGQGAARTRSTGQSEPCDHHAWSRSRAAASNCGNAGCATTTRSPGSPPRSPGGEHGSATRRRHARSRQVASAGRRL